jgi:hypothetical protein
MARLLYTIPRVVLCFYWLVFPAFFSEDAFPSVGQLVGGMVYKRQAIICLITSLT